jgi:hypothetical protein
VVVGVAAVVLNIIVFDAVVVEAAEDLFRRGAEVNPRWFTSVSLPFSSIRANSDISV